MDTTSSLPTFRLDLPGIGARLRAERDRLNWTQDYCGEIGGVNRITQSRYESGRVEPGLAYLQRLQERGIDVGYILSGKPFALNNLGTEEFSLLAAAFASVHALLNQYNIQPPPEQTLKVVLRTFHGSLPANAPAKPKLNDFFVASEK